MRQTPPLPTFIYTIVIAVVLFGILLHPYPSKGAPLICPHNMVLINQQYCIDPFENALEVRSAAQQNPQLWPHNQPPTHQSVKAISQRGVYPQSYISGSEANEACHNAGKRLCTNNEWQTACQGSVPSTYPYGSRFRSGYCNDEGVSPLRRIFGPNVPFDQKYMNDPKLVTLVSTVVVTGLYSKCTSGNGVFDMVGNVHEWIDDPSGTFRGGYFLDTKTLGEGCNYKTTGHTIDYRDYSTGFRCCADALSQTN